METAIDIGIWRIDKTANFPDIVWGVFSDQDFTNLALKIGQRGNFKPPIRNTLPKGSEFI
jgi:hypothetical protein